MRSSRGIVKLMDFGIAKSFEGATSGTTATGNIVGTPEYMSPEQARAAKVDGRSDIYALGIVVFELFTGEVPFRGDTPVATLFKHIQDVPALNRGGLPAVLLPILQKALAKAPEDRYQTAKEFAEALRLARMQSLPLFATPVPMATATSPLRDLMPLEAETTPIPTAVPTAVPTPKPAPSQAAPTHAAPTQGIGVDIGPKTSPQEVSPPRRPEARRPASRPSRPELPHSAPAKRTAWLIGVPSALVLGIGGMLLLRAPGRRTTPSSPEPVTRASLPVALPSTALETSTLPTTLPARIEATTSPAPASIPVAPTLPRIPSPAPKAPSAIATPASVRGPTPTALPSPSRRVEATPVPTTLAPAPSAAGPVPAPSPKEAVSAPEPVPQAGTLQLVVVPWADVEVDGVKMGTSPPLRPLNLPAGIHLIRLTHPSYTPFPRRVTIRSGETTKLQVDLTKEAFPK